MAVRYLDICASTAATIDDGIKINIDVIVSVRGGGRALSFRSQYCYCTGGLFQFGHQINPIVMNKIQLTKSLFSFSPLIPLAIRPHTHPPFDSAAAATASEWQNSFNLL